MQAIEIIGQRFGRLVVLEEDGRLSEKRAYRCQCDCGKATRTTASNLRRGMTTSCGCRKAERDASGFNRKHGLTSHPLFWLWCRILNRCYNANDRSYKDYGGRGITIWPPWKKDVKKFVGYILTELGEGKPGLTIDRIDNERGYEPGNLRWATRSQQMINRRPNNGTKFITIEVNGCKVRLGDAARAAGLTYEFVYERIVRQGWTPERALSEPVNSYRTP